MKTALQALLFLLGILACCAVSYLIGVRRGYERGSDCPVKSDTCWVVDTHFIEKPIPVEVKPSGVEMYPIGTLAQLQGMVDSLRSIKPDTTFVELPIPMEVKKYSDETFEAQISGFNANLDWISVFPKTAYITNTVMEKRKWGFGASVGPSIIYDGHIHAGLGVTFGLQYNF